MKLYQSVDFDDDLEPRQIGFYDPGVGTGNPRGAITRTRVFFSRLIGLAFGVGIYRNMSDAYRYLMDHYQPGDRVYIFGFSRGAYTTRALVGMLHLLGLLHAGASNLIPYALELYRKKIPKQKDKKDKYFEVVRGFRKTYSRECKPHFIGVWDTVKTVGIWDAAKIAAKWQTALPYTSDMPDVAFGRHAISIDEKRSRFRPNMWRPYDNNNMQQVWFSGVHSDVGGGYKEAGLSDIALKWLLKGAEHQGLALRADAYENLNPNETQKMHNSLTWYWLPAGWSRRTVRGPGEWNPEKRSWVALPPSVHESVRVRRDKVDYDPGLPDDARFVDDSWDSYCERPEG